MSTDFAQQIKLAQQRLEEMCQRASQTPVPSELLSESLEALSQNLEQLQVIQEELISTQATLTAERQRYQELFNSALDGYLVTDDQGVIQEANRTVATLLNTTQESLLSQPLVVLIAEANRQDFCTQLNQLRLGAEVKEWETRFQKQGEKPFYAAIKVASVRNSAGEIVNLRWILRDISDRKQTEAALTEQREFLRNVIDTNPNLIFVKNWQGQFTLANQALAQLYGTTVEDLVGKIDADFNPNLAEVEQYLRDDQEVMTTLQPKLIPEETVCSPNGEIRWLQTIKKPLISVDPQIRHVLCVATDITERKQAEVALKQANEELETRVEERTAALRQINQQLMSEIAERQLIEAALRHSETRFQKLVANVPGMIYQFLLRPDGSYSFPYLSPGCREFCGREPEEIQENPALVFECTHPDDQWEFEESIRISATTLQPWKYEWRIITPSGQIKWMRGVSRPERQENGAILWDGLLMDITERKQAEEALRESEERLRVALEAAQMGTWDWNILAGVVTWSPKVEQLFGFTPGNYDNAYQTFLSRIYPEDREFVLQAKDRSISQGEEYDIEFRVVRLDDTVRWIASKGQVFYDETGRAVRMAGVEMDITERKQTEQALRRQLAAIEAATDGIAILNQQQQFIYLNSAHVHLFGYQSATELVGKTWRELYCPDEISRFERDIFSIVRQYGEWRGEAIGKKQGGSTFAQEVALTGIDDCGLICVCRDITQRKQAENELRESEERFRQLADNIAQMFWISTPSREQFIYISPAYESIWRRSCQSLYEDPKSWLVAVHPDDRDQLLTTIENRFGKESEEEYRIIHPDGAVHWIRNRAFPIRNAEGIVYRLAGIAEDITERKRAEEEVRFLQTMTQAIFESEDFHSALEVALHKVCEATGWNFGEAWIPRADRTALECSPAWYTNTETLHEFRRLSERMTFAPGVGLPGRVWQSKQPEWYQDVSAESAEVYLRAKAALAVGLKAALGIPILVNDEVLGVLVFYMFEAKEQDEHLIGLISASAELGLFIQRKRTEEEIRQALEKERELNELKSKFISMVSHEFRTPLSTIVLSTDLLENYSHRYDEAKKQQYFQRIRSASQRMTKLLEDVLFIGKAEAGKLEFNPVLLNLETFCRDMVEEFQLSAGSQYSLTFICESKCPDAYMDEKLLQHIFSNLLSNAIKYSPTGGAIRFTLRCDHETAEFQISDQGIGILPEDEQRLFESFHRASNVGTIPGTGLGLSIVKKCIDLQGGKITVKSQVGMGSTFTVSLPLQPNQFKTL